MEGQRNPLEQALCLSVTLHAFGTSRKVDPELVDTDADRKLLKVSKRIFESNAMEQIKMLYGEIRSHLQRYTIVGAMFKSGLYLVPFDQVTQVESFIRGKQELLSYWVFQLGEEYEVVKERFREQLGSLYNESDYPFVSKVKSQFSIDYEFLALDVPAALRYINSDIWHSEQEKARIRVQAVAERIEQILTESMQDLIEHLVERLTDTDDGKRKKFATNMVDKARDFFETFRSKNLTGAESLNDLAEQGLVLLQGIDLDSLKNQARMRERVRDGFAEIKSRMSAMHMCPLKPLP
jgi:hypothetical protein